MGMLLLSHVFLGSKISVKFRRIASFFKTVYNIVFFCEQYLKIIREHTKKISCSVEKSEFRGFFKECPVYEKKLDIPEMLFQEVHPDCFLVSFGECAPTVTLDQTRLSHGTISHNHNLKNHKKTTYK